MTMGQHSPLPIVLHSLANHLDHIHDDLYEHYEPVMEAAHKEQRSKLAVVDNGGGS